MQGAQLLAFIAKIRKAHADTFNSHYKKACIKKCTPFYMTYGAQHAVGLVSNYRSPIIENVRRNSSEQ